MWRLYADIYATRDDEQTFEVFLGEHDTHRQAHKTIRDMTTIAERTHIEPGGTLDHVHYPLSRVSQFRIEEV